MRSILYRWLWKRRVPEHGNVVVTCPKCKMIIFERVGFASTLKPLMLSIPHLHESDCIAHLRNEQMTLRRALAKLAENQEKLADSVLDIAKATQEGGFSWLEDLGLENPFDKNHVD